MARCDRVYIDVPLRVATPDGFKLICGSHDVCGYDDDWRPIIWTRWGRITLPDMVDGNGVARYDVLGS